MNSNQSENNIVMSYRMRLKLFYIIHKQTIFVVMIPLILLPVVFIGDKKAYLCFYAFLITATYWIFEVLNPAVISLIPIGLSTVMNWLGYEIISIIHIHHALFDCFGMLIFIVAIEDCHIHKRIALKILLIFGCSHYRFYVRYVVHLIILSVVFYFFYQKGIRKMVWDTWLCFLTFFTTMLLSMWISNTLACGFMLPIVKATMMELEKMGILEMYEITEEVRQGKQRNKNNRIQKPTDFLVFYFLGIAYSSSIGGMASIVGSHTNQIFKAYSETMFPDGSKIEFPQFVLLTLPGVLVLETAVYLWMNFYFLGLFKIHNYSALHTGSTEEETQYTKTLLKNQYQKLGKITDKELIVAVTILLCVLLHMTTSTYACKRTRNYVSSHIQVSAPVILCTIILFITPTNLEFLKCCKNRSGEGLDSVPSTSSKPCLDWKTVKNEIHWNVLLVTGASCAMFEGLKQSKMTDEFERFLRVFGEWSAVVLVLVVVVFCKILTEFASNICVANCMLDHVTRVSLTSRVNPHYLMLATALSCSLPFHLITGTPAHAMVSSYFKIPHRTMIYAGIGPTIFSVIIIWFTVTVWSRVIWTEINVFPDWANNHRNVSMLS